MTFNPAGPEKRAEEEGLKGRKVVFTKHGGSERVERGEVKVESVDKKEGIGRRGGSK